MKRTNNLFLFGVVFFLLLIIIAEIYYVFFSQKQDNFVEITKVSTGVQSGAPQRRDINSSISDEQTKRVFDSISTHQNVVRSLYKTGVLTNYTVTETYQSTIVEFEKKDTVVTEKGKDIHFSFILSFKNNTPSGDGKTTFLFSDKEVSRITAVKLDGTTKIPISLSEIQPGDTVSIAMQSNYLVNPIDSLVSMKITKLQ